MVKNLFSKKNITIFAIAAFVVAALSLFLAKNYYEQSDLLPLTINTEENREGDFPWNVDAASSALNVRVTHEGKFVEGSIPNWSAQINVDPENLETAFIDLNIDMRSIEVSDFTDTIRSADFLNVEAYPTARFLSDFIWRRSDGDYDAEGLLEIAGQQRPFTIKLSMRFIDDKAQITGYTGINRVEWKIGEEVYPDDTIFGLPFEFSLSIAADKAW